jgi:4-amino-4-deoxy-L-arabinose transferase-like glycosyltransferase
VPPTRLDTVPAVTSRTFRRGLVAATALGLAVRLAYILVVRNDVGVGGDALFYHLGARLLVDGYGFIEPSPAIVGITEQSASHPPLYLLWLAIPTSVGLDGPVSHMLWSSLIGAGSVVVIGLLGREVAGPRAGIIAAGIAAVYPNLWVYDGFLLSETTAIFTGVLTVLLGYRFLRDPTPRRAVYLGLAAGVAALARAELVLLIPLLVVPLVWLIRNHDVRTRLKWMLVAVLAAALPITPWVVFNLTRFDRPVLLSTGLEPTLLGANCDVTYYGKSLGYFSPNCLDAAAGKTKAGTDQSVRNDVYRRIVREYVGDHKARVPVVVLARWGRVTGLFRPGQQVEFDDFIEGRELWVASLSLFSFYMVAALAVAGGVILRRRRTPVYPLVVLPVIMLFAVAIALGSVRYRASAEGALVVLAAVTIDAGLRRWTARRTGADARENGEDAPVREAVVPAGAGRADGD